MDCSVSNNISKIAKVVLLSLLALIAASVSAQDLTEKDPGCVVGTVVTQRDIRAKRDLRHLLAGQAPGERGGEKQDASKFGHPRLRDRDTGRH